MKQIASLAQFVVVLGLVALSFFVLSAHAQTDAILPPIGGGGGSPFVARCPQGELLTGFDLWTGDDVDAIRPICIPAVAGQFQSYPLRFGGDGGAPQQLVCPNDAPVVIAMEIGSEGVTEVVNNIHLSCGHNVATAQRPAFALAVYDGPKYTGEPGWGGKYASAPASERQHCPEGLEAVGINGRSGVWLDALGLICGALPLREAAPVKAQGRVKLDPTETAPSPPRAICDLAREARARNSPAAPGLEAKCRAAGAAGETPPVKAQGRVNLSPAGGAPPRPICDVAREARTRNSPAAPGLEEKCRIDLAAKGAAIAQMDESVAAARTAERARTAETEVLYRQGFDIATGIFGNPALGAQGNTAMGPGSEGIRKSLDSTAGQRGFDASVAFHLNQTYPH